MLKREVTGLILAGVMVAGLQACDSDSDSQPVQEQPSDNNGDVVDDCPEGCPAGRVRVPDSAARCGFHCESMSDDMPLDVGEGPSCDTVCPEGSRRVQDPQSECGFVCRPIMGEDGSSFDHDVDPRPDVEEDVPDTPPAAFTVRIENISGSTSLPLGLTPGVWALHTSEGVFFTDGAPDRGEGLEALAEDGDPAALAAAVEDREGVQASGVFNTPEGAGTPGTAGPEGAFVFTVEAPGGSPPPRLSFVTSLTETNDAFLGTVSEGIALFDAQGAPLDEHTVDIGLAVWDAGTEANERPGLGPDQPPRQSAPGVGRAEGRLGAFTDTTRALPIAPRMALVTVEGPSAEGAFTVHVQNVSGSVAVTALSPVFWAVHGGAWSLYEEGDAASAGLEVLAESGVPSALVTEHTGATGVEALGAATEPDERPGATDVIAPGERYTFEVTPTSAAPWLTLATMVYEANDTFIATPPAGVRLLDEQGMPRPLIAINDELTHLLLLDAGTEANQAPGVGADQGARQAADTDGEADPDTGVRRYDDTANDLADAGSVLTVTVSDGDAGEYIVTIENTASAGFGVALSPLVWAVHDDTTALFEDAAVASAPLVGFVDDGDPVELLAALQQDAGVLSSELIDTPEGAGSAAPLQPGERYTFAVTPSGAQRLLSFATAVVPSNDAFIALTPAGVALLDDQGALRPAADVAADLNAALRAWDAGAEENQAAELGRDQRGRQSQAGAGMSEGDGTVRPIADGWAYPWWTQLVRVTVTPVED